jgi:prepilin-type N-terminal cleavage/methylation domain-containing protein
LRQRLRQLRLVRDEGGYNLIEMLTVMIIMGVVMAGLTDIFTSASKADTDMSNRFQAQLTIRVALDKLRRDIHCASDVTPYATNALTLKIPSGCGGDVSYCTAAMSGISGRWSLYRELGDSCDSTAGTRFAKYLTTANVFPAFTVHTVDTLSSVSVDLPVEVNTRSNVGAYELKDTIFLRNSTRS